MNEYYLVATVLWLLDSTGVQVTILGNPEGGSVFTDHESATGMMRREFGDGEMCIVLLGLDSKKCSWVAHEIVVHTPVSLLRDYGKAERLVEQVEYLVAYHAGRLGIPLAAPAEDK